MKNGMVRLIAILVVAISIALNVYFIRACGEKDSGPKMVNENSPSDTSVEEIARAIGIPVEGRTAKELAEYLLGVIHAAPDAPNKVFSEDTIRGLEKCLVPNDRQLLLEWHAFAQKVVRHQCLIVPVPR